MRRVDERVLQEEAQEMQINAMTNLQVPPAVQPEVWGDDVMVGPPLQNQLVMPPQQPMTGGMIGGLPSPNFASMVGEGVLGGSTLPGMGPMIAVRTDADAFAQDGIMLDGATRPIRRNYYRGPSAMGGPMGPAVERYAPAMGGGGNFLSAMSGSPNGGPPATVTVNKLES